MTFWDGNRWVDDRPATPSKPSRLSAWLATGAMLIGLVAIVAPLTFVAAARHNNYTGTLAANPSSVHAGDSFTVSGCGYDTRLGNVIVGFTGGSWGSPLDAGGCFSIAGIPALSGDTLPAGAYDVYAFQYVRGRLKVTGETTLTVTP